MSKKDLDIKNNIVYINSPITTLTEDKIGIAQYISELREVIDSGAQSIAITSDFGGGKSSLVKNLESTYCKSANKFCYINLWSQMTSGNNNNLHKSFIYQLASQISIRKGNYVSKRISENYGLLGITLSSTWAFAWSIVILLMITLAFASTMFYDKISKYLSIEWYNTYHNEIGVICFLISAFLLIIMFFRSDIMFSSTHSETNRKLDEHEIMDIYKTTICKYHFRHYIVVIEDLDRSNKNYVNKFIKELRRYYIPYKKKNRKFKYKFLNKIYSFFYNRNRITFIVNIKPENEIAKDDDENLYSKAFDYVLNLKEIDIDNFDVVLKNLLESNRALFIENRVPVFKKTNDPVKKDEFITEFEWLIRGKKLTIREIKTRLNTAISTYNNLASKFPNESISLKKCIAATYILTEFEKEYFLIKDKGILDQIINLYIEDPKTVYEKTIEQNKADIAIKETFVKEIINLIENGLIASDYKQYFYNLPSDSYLYSEKQVKLVDAILYDYNIKDPNEFNSLVTDVINERDEVIIQAFSRLKNLNLRFPKCVFENKELFELALSFDYDMVFDSISEKLEYDNASISSTSQIIISIINSSLFEKQEYIDEICDIVIAKSSPASVVVFRKEIIENFYSDIIKYKKLFLDRCPLITKLETTILKESEYLLDLINYNSTSVDIGWVEHVQKAILTGQTLSNDTILDKIAEHYKKLYMIFNSTENKRLNKFLFEIMDICKKININMEKLIVENNDFKDIIDDYSRIICLVGEYGELSPNTLSYINTLGINNILSKKVCYHLYEVGYYKSFIINACATEISMIDFHNENIIDAIKDIDFFNGTDNFVTLETLYKIRKYILEYSQDNAFKQYKWLFFSPFPLISIEETRLISQFAHLEQKIDTTQLTEENSKDFAKILSERVLNLNDSYELLCFVQNIKSTTIKKTFFLALDFNNIQYYRISKTRKSKVLDIMSDIYNFKNIKDIIEFMKKTKSTYAEFEKQIKNSILENKFTIFEQEYISYIKNAKRITNDMIANLCLLKGIYPMPLKIQEKLFSLKKYNYYVVSKIKYEEEFIFETDKLNVLANIYEELFFSSDDVIKQYMCGNIDFISYLANKKMYLDVSKEDRICFANCLQSKDNLAELFENYDDDFIKKYLLSIEGFVDKEAAAFLVEQIKLNTKLRESEILYNYIYKKLNDSSLKSSYTRYHNSAIYK